MKMVLDLERDIYSGQARYARSTDQRKLFYLCDPFIAPTLSNLRRCNVRDFQQSNFYRSTLPTRIYVHQFVCGRYCFECPRLLSRPFLARWWRFILLLTISFSHHFVYSETQCDVYAGQREEYRAVYRDLTTRPYFRLSMLEETVLKTCTRLNITQSNILMQLSFIFNNYIYLKDALERNIFIFLIL